MTERRGVTWRWFRKHICPNCTLEVWEDLCRRAKCPRWKRLPVCHCPTQRSS